MTEYPQIGVPPWGLGPSEELDERDEVKTLNIIKELTERGERTPDAYELRKYQNILLFVYDGFKRGGKENHHLKAFPYLGRARTANDMYQMKINNGLFPVVLDTKLKSTPSRGFIFGQVYVVPPEVIFGLDKYKFNGKLFKRVKRSILMTEQDTPFKTGGSPSAMCQMYLGDDEYWENMSGLKIGSSYTSYASQVGRSSRFYEYHFAA